MNDTTPTLSEGRRLQYIHDNRVIDCRWQALTKEQRRFVLDGMQLGVNEQWILDLIEDAKELRRRKEVN